MRLHGWLRQQVACPLRLVVSSSDELRNTRAVPGGSLLRLPRAAARACRATTGRAGQSLSLSLSLSRDISLWMSRLELTAYAPAITRATGTVGREADCGMQPGRGGVAVASGPGKALSSARVRGDDGERRRRPTSTRPGSCAASIAALLRQMAERRKRDGSQLPLSRRHVSQPFGGAAF